eukprot:10747025-Karenia_brevis.AAC.1
MCIRDRQSIVNKYIFIVHHRHHHLRHHHDQHLHHPLFHQYGMVNKSYILHDRVALTTTMMMMITLLMVVVIMILVVM